jgi:lipid-A-disaccharide synthase
MGWVEAARQAPRFLGRLNRAHARLLADPPDVLVLIDFSGFNLALLRRLGRRIRTVYYVPPMVSVRRGNRAARVAALGARLLAIFPFEADAYARAGADVTFVGHPAVDLRDVVEPADRVRARLGVEPASPVLGLLPGSRQQELDYLLEPMMGAAQRVRAALPGLAVVLALASPIFRERVERAVAASHLPVKIVDGARDVMAASTVLLTASGTATVEAMIIGVPMVVTYRSSRVNWWIAHLAVHTRWAAIPNILAGETVVPELLQERATPERLGDALLTLLREPGAQASLRARLAQLAAVLGPPGAPRRAAAEVLAALGAPALQADLAIT